MLIQFTTGNCLSFKEKATLSMVPHARLKDHRATNLIAVSNKLSLLKSCAIYGANASGKSNLVVAIRSMRRFVLNSFRDIQLNEKIPIKNFRLSTETENKPSFFEIVILEGSAIYRYGFEIDESAVRREWLLMSSRLEGKETELFHREEGKISISPNFGEGERLNSVQAVESLVRPNALFLSVAAQFNGEIATGILRWFKNLTVISGLSDSYEKPTVRRLCETENADFKKEIVEFLRAADLGIDDIAVMQPKVENLPPAMPDRIRQDILAGKNLMFHQKLAWRKKYDAAGKVVASESLDLDSEESAGTGKLFALSGPILDALKGGKVLVVDELDSRLHPLITQYLAALFNSEENSKSQLIFTTHDNTILRNKFFRKDQIWFTEKNNYGATSLYSLVEYKTTVRNDASFGKDYLEGKYGAIPLVRQFSR